MPRAGERAPGRVIARAIVVAIVALAMVPAYLGLPAPWQPAAGRIAGAALVALGCARAFRWLRRTAEPLPSSPLDAPEPAVAPPELDARVMALHDDLISSARRRRYFDAILWPRLLRLAGGELAPPAAGRGRRGPSIDRVEQLVEQIERRG